MDYSFDDLQTVGNLSYELYGTDFVEYLLTPWVEIIAGAIVASLIILGNGTLLLSILINYWHRTSQFNLFVADLCLSHLLVGAFLLPMKLDAQFWGKWRHGQSLCVAWGAVDHIRGTVSLFILLGLALDRFLRVLGRGFSGKASRMACTLFLILPWLLACLLNLPVVLLGFSQLLIENLDFCVLSLPSSHYVVLTIATFIVPGFFVIVLCLGSVLYWIFSSDSRLRDRDAPDVTKLKWQIISMTTVSFITLILEAPYTILLLLSNFVDIKSSSYLMYAISTWVYLSTSAVIPFVWLVYPDVRMALKDLVHCRMS